MKSGTVGSARSFNEISHTDGLVTVFWAFVLVTVKDLAIPLVRLDFPGGPLVLVLNEDFTVVSTERSLGRFRGIEWSWLEAFK